MRKRLFSLISLLVLLAVLTSACAPAATQAPAKTEAPAATQAPAATEAPAQTEAPALPVPGAGRLTLATTTSTQDSGLLDVLLPLFEKEAGVKVDVIAVGTGQALKLGEDGNADVLLVHSRSNEDKFMDAGHGVRREDVMYNDFVIVCAESDPAGIKGTSDAVAAFKQITEKKVTFISRGDESGTHSKEKSIWAKAEIEPAGDWYVSAGQGMGEVLTMADEQQACTLSARATYLARTKEGLKLAIMVEGDKTLFNPYGVIAVNPEKNPNIQKDLANKFIDWIISVPVQEEIAKFGQKDFGQSLFTPSSKPWMDAHPAPAAAASTEAPAAAGGAPADAALKVTGKVAQEIGWTEAEVKAMKTTEATSPNKKGESETYTGVLLTDLLALAGGALPEATKVTFVANDGFTAEVPLADLLACKDCIVSFRSQGGFSTVMPGFPGKLQVKGIVEIKVE